MQIMARLGRAAVVRLPLGETRLGSMTVCSTGSHPERNLHCRQGDLWACSGSSPSPRRPAVSLHSSSQSLVHARIALGRRHSLYELSGCAGIEGDMVFDTFKEQQKQYKALLEGSKVSGWSHLTHASGRLHHSWSWACQDVGAAAVWMLP